MIDHAALMDPAHQSLADALRLTFRLLKLGMLVLLVLFLLSGFESIREGQRGIRLLFGAPQGQPLDSGFRFSAPYPVGEMIRVNTGAVHVDVDRAFWPALSDKDRLLSIEQLAGRGRSGLKPGVDGSVLTADGNIGHTQWSVVYQRSDPEQWVRNVYTPDEERLIRLAVERGIVQAIANVTIDELLKQATNEQNSVQQYAAGVAQAMLDRMSSGLTISKLSLERKMAPLSLYDAFSLVESAQSRANEQREKAEAERRRTLNAMAGRAVPYLIEQIGAYEASLALGDKAAQEKILTTIDALLEGKPVKVGDEVVENVVSGEVTTILSEAGQYRTNIVSERQADLTEFRAKLGQFKTNPLVMVHTSWESAVSAFVARDNVQLMLVPPGVRTLELLLNRDPDIAKTQQSAARKRANEEAARRRELMRKQEKYKLDDAELMSTGGPH
jgi:membrane protease subunit HflK